LGTTQAAVKLRAHRAYESLRDVLAGRRVVLVHDWLTGMRGGEKVLESLCRLLPDADRIVVVAVNSDAAIGALEGAKSAGREGDVWVSGQGGLENARDLIRADQGKDKGERKFTDDMRDGVMREVIAQHVLLGWEGLEDESGEPLAYSQAEAVKLLADPTMHRLVQWLETAASSAEVYRVERLERDRKN
jgi:hypothetical protein